MRQHVLFSAFRSMLLYMHTMLTTNHYAIRTLMLQNINAVQKEKKTKTICSLFNVIRCVLVKKTHTHIETKTSILFKFCESALKGSAVLRI